MNKLQKFLVEHKTKFVLFLSKSLAMNIYARMPLTWALRVESLWNPNAASSWSIQPRNGSPVWWKSAKSLHRGTGVLVGHLRSLFKKTLRWNRTTRRQYLNWRWKWLRYAIMNPNTCTILVVNLFFFHVNNRDLLKKSLLHHRMRTRFQWSPLYVANLIMKTVWTALCRHWRVLVPRTSSTPLTMDHEGFDCCYLQLTTICNQNR